MSGQRGVALLGATGSIGRSTLNVLARHPERFRIVSLAAGRRAGELDRLASMHEPDYVVLAEGPDPGFEARWGGPWRFGREAMLAAAADPDAGIVVNALVGFAGLESTLLSLEAGKRLALANKESLVAGGDLVLGALNRGGGELLPVDSEHSAILQCLHGRPASEVNRIILTASGGPFREWPRSRFDDIRPADALAHPTWEMGSKITVDSATLANKALEVIEGHLLFGIDYDRIEVVIHPASIVHSMVEFRDGSTVAQLSYPTMEVPILYALAAPERLDNDFQPFDPVAAGPLVFEAVRRQDFPMFDLGVEAGRTGGTAPAVYSAANEMAVQAFLEERIGFQDIAALVADVLDRADVGSVESVAHLEEVDAESRARVAGRVGTPSGARGE